MRFWLISLFVFGICLFSPFSPLYAAESIPYELQKVGIEEKSGEKISLDLTFQNEKGETVALKSFFDGKTPVILTLVYYNCPNLCHILLDGFTETLKETPWTVGEQFKIVTVSIDPTETAALSSKKKSHRLQKYGRPHASKGWHFLTGTEKNIKQLAAEVGFGYRYDEDQKQYAHSAGLFVLTPEGVISRTLYGIQFKPFDLKLSLLEASKGKIGNVVDKLLLFCYHYDPKGRKYAIFARNLMSVAGLVMVLLIIIFLGILFRREKKKI